MRRFSFVLLSALFLAFTCKSSAQTFDIFENRFSLHNVIGFPPSDYGWIPVEGDDLADDYQYRVSFGFKMGTQWSFSTWEHFGIGLKINWFEVSYVQRKYDIQGDQLKRFTLDITFGEFGPICTFAINKMLGFDTYYNLRPTFLLTRASQEYYYYDDGYNYYDQEIGLGFGHLFGFAFRFHVLSVGLEYVLGNLPNLDYIDQYGYFGGPRLSDSSFRLIVGVVL